MSSPGPLQARRAAFSCGFAIPKEIPEAWTKTRAGFRIPALVEVSFAPKFQEVERYRCTEVAIGFSPATRGYPQRYSKAEYLEDVLELLECTRLAITVRGQAVLRARLGDFAITNAAELVGKDGLCIVREDLAPYVTEFLVYGVEEFGARLEFDRLPRLMGGRRVSVVVDGELER